MRAPRVVSHRLALTKAQTLMLRLVIGTASTNVEDRKPTSSSSNLGFARFNLPEGYVSLVPPKLGTGTGKSDQGTPTTKPLAKEPDVPSPMLRLLAAGAAVVPPTPMPAPTANSAPQVHNAPQPSGLGSQADTSPITFRKSSFLRRFSILGRNSVSAFLFGGGLP